MLNTSEFAIKTAKSWIYFRLTMTAYSVAGILLAISALWMVIKFFLFIVILWQISAINKYKKPHPFLEQIAYRNHGWTIKDKQSYLFKEVRLLVNTDLFQLLLFSSDNDKKHIVIFKDQLNPTEYWQLQLFLQQIT
ncbi:Uncharacterised protein [Legionella israelensis]|nr:Uncharacterised protein [Legionella israelensis]